MITWRTGPTGTVVVHSPANFWIMHAETANISCSALYVFLIHMLLQLIICGLEINLSLGEHLPTTVSHALTHRFSQLDKQGGWITYLSCSNSKFLQYALWHAMPLVNKIRTDRIRMKHVHMHTPRKL
jgi:hypothetical protein